MRVDEDFRSLSDMTLLRYITMECIDTNVMVAKTLSITRPFVSRMPLAILSFELTRQRGNNLMKAYFVILLYLSASCCLLI